MPACLSSLVLSKLSFRVSLFPRTLQTLFPRTLLLHSSTLFNRSAVTTRIYCVFSNWQASVQLPFPLFVWSYLTPHSLTFSEFGLGLYVKKTQDPVGNYKQNMGEEL